MTAELSAISVFKKIILQLGGLENIMKKYPTDEIDEAWYFIQRTYDKISYDSIQELITSFPEDINSVERRKIEIFTYACVRSVLIDFLYAALNLTKEPEFGESTEYWSTLSIVQKSHLYWESRKINEECENDPIRTIIRTVLYDVELRKQRTLGNHSVIAFVAYILSKLRSRLQAHIKKYKY